MRALPAKIVAHYINGQQNILKDAKATAAQHHEG
jgi:hypothetical protein